MAVRCREGSRLMKAIARGVAAVKELWHGGMGGKGLSGGMRHLPVDVTIKHGNSSGYSPHLGTRKNGHLSSLGRHKY